MPDLSAQFAGIQWWQLVVAAIVGILGWIAARYAHRGMVALLRKVPNIPEAYVQPVSRGVEYLVIAFGIGLALAILGANIQPLLAVVILVGVVVVLVLRGTADNFASSVVIQSRRTVQVGDIVQVDTPDGAMTGTVAELNARAVILVTADGATVHVPNSKLLSDSVVNLSSHGRSRSQVQVRLERRDDDTVEALLARLAGVAGTASAAVSDPAATVSAVSPARVIATVGFWHPPADGASATSDVVRALADAFHAEQREATVTGASTPLPLTPPDSL
ncbi:mechanosensitive ion channel family protein [Microbacterium sp. KUDC0406]|uniref:mechanosensitive ion channel domain-containing protein n=1 Tax=Microbacterium sp. KUDC0406 TaxID=2909588 RepID=UPI001F2B1332|nr:mechanosensitive ion channel family protein [Microbacterium sp. KUDC0406]UJP10719.1 mechanosensitive ion channel family protein [Microbacterium sp. KUDC0406]